ncbi:type I-G CRISPR-associated protein Cas8g1/Csx17 [Kyrpidia spormannii]|uniref:Type I-U CRISPR-associated protein Csx17 n=2 Tax=Kyrpidia spormannii TaxID=2055160 RepID=A0ACA8ZCN6_9BACL|nr:type I-U CRISPR-associated protein Csx17 [Kyrpidia spormannii]CAB3394732.1 Type I-U CRISPR-associated protein Csx17 [Kyrpidia spormannii]CAB3395701.1 Type I-U CRISPR-associated protein Csx17 [Kyrpidia spormannii]
MIQFTGTAPRPLSHYLKAMGVLRLLVEQADPHARGWWEDETFCVETSLSSSDVEMFLLTQYRPTPLVTPWNGGSGFFGRDEALHAIETSETDRLSAYRTTIEEARRILQAFGFEKKPDNKDKRPLVQACRNRFPDEAIAWLDASVVLTTGDLGFPPLAGTGGNDGNLEFSNNFMQRILNVMSPVSGDPAPMAATWLRAALWGEPTSGLMKGAIGQFSPGEAGGPNARSGFSGNSLVNPWDFILMLEGALLFASAATKRLERQSASVVAAPFTVHPTAVGHGSTADSDNSRVARAEMWLPMWSQPVSLRELQYVFREGRAQLAGNRSRRVAKNGVDFARACATLAVDRGIDSFQRYSFLKRYGKAYLAVPLNRFVVQRRPYAELLSEADNWIELFSRVENTSHSFQSALRKIREAEFLYCQYGGSRRMQELLIALGRAEKLLSQVTSAREKVPPLTLRNPAWWEAADDGSWAFQAARGFVSTLPGTAGSIRSFLSPVEPDQPGRWNVESSPPRVVWKSTDLATNLAAVLRRRFLEAEWAEVDRGDRRGIVRPESVDKPTAGLRPVPVWIVVRLLHETNSDRRIADLIWGLLPLSQSARPGGVFDRSVRREESKYAVPWVYILARLITAPDAQIQRIFPGVAPVPVPNQFLASLAAGDLDRAERMAEHRLRGSGFASPFFQKGVSSWLSRSPVADRRRMGTRIVAMLALPVADWDLRTLAHMAALATDVGAQEAVEHGPPFADEPTR